MWLTYYINKYKPTIIKTPNLDSGSLKYVYI